MAKVCVLIVTYKSDSTIARCLAALERQSFRDFEVVIVENGETTTLDDAVKTLTVPVQVIKPGRNLGFAPGNNLAAHHAATGTVWLALLNPDAYAKPDWLAQFDAATRKYPKCAMFGSLQFMADREEICDGFGDNYHIFGLAWRDHHGWKLPDNIHDTEMFSPCGAAAFYRLELFKRIGGFDDSYFCYFEDVDFAFRARLMGEYCVQLCAAQVYHVGGASGTSAFAIYHGLRNLIWTFFKCMPQPLLLLFLPGHILTVVMLVARYAVQGHYQAASKGVRDALKNYKNIMYQRKVVQRTRRATPWEMTSAFTWSLTAPFKHAIRRKQIETAKQP